MSVSKKYVVTDEPIVAAIAIDVVAANDKEENK